MKWNYGSRTDRTGLKERFPPSSVADVPDYDARGRTSPICNPCAGPLIWMAGGSTSGYPWSQ